MTINDKDKISLIKHRLLQAEETIEDVLLLIQNNRLRSAVKIFKRLVNKQNSLLCKGIV